ncbi:membrane hypothetical protein [Candidatus Xenohaliotis californiensis]|uniref:Uncharacterized protein n=1 Tax=Candidatus Xenohaliotis californiensis TaxID=84677 RepID=A0ABM9N8F7_9RICK|nr:membrane hypothetical protein [Candidatus Xenohaliotis californiensis]
MGLSWLDQYLQQCHYYNPHGNNLYDKIGNPLFLSQNILSSDGNPLEQWSYTIEQISPRQLQELYPDMQKKPGDVLSLDIHGFGKYYLSIIKISNTNQPLCNNNGHFVYQMFLNPHLTKPSYNQYYWEKYKKYSDDINSYGAACVYIQKSKKQQGVHYSIPSSTTKINLHRPDDRELFNHRVARAIKIPYCEPPFISPISPPITIEYNEFDIFAWFNRVLYFIFSTQETIIKLIGLVCSVIFGTIGSIIQQAAQAINSIINAKITSLIKDKKKAVTILARCIHYITHPAIAALYIVGLSISYTGHLAQSCANFFASILSFPTYYYRAGGIDTRIKIICSQIYCIFTGIFAIFVLLPIWIGDVFANNFSFHNMHRTLATKPSTISAVTAKLFYAISVIMQGILELTGGIADIETHHHNIAIIDGFFSRYFSIISNHLGSWLKIITATAKDMKANFYTNEDGSITRKTTEINNTLMNVNHREPSFTAWYKPLGNSLSSTVKDLVNFNVIPADSIKKPNTDKSEENIRENEHSDSDLKDIMEKMSKNPDQQQPEISDMQSSSNKQPDKAEYNPETAMKKTSMMPNNLAEEQDKSTIPA